MAGPDKKDEPFFYCDMCSGMLPIEVGDKSDIVKGQLLAAAICLPVALLMFGLFQILR